MLTVAVISQKGGTGKTTVALNLAVAASLAGRSAVVVDLDPQASATAWSDQREKEEPLVVPAQASRLATVLATVEEHGGELALIDTAPHSEASALAAARAADVVLIPCRPQIFDLRAMEASADLASLAGSRAAAVLNAVQPRGGRSEDAEEAIRAYGLDVSPKRIGHRVAFGDAATAGRTPAEFEPGGKAAREVGELYEWLLEYAKREGREAA